MGEIVLPTALYGDSNTMKVQQTHKALKRKCDEISKDNEVLASRLVNLKYLIYKADMQRRRLQERLELHGVDYHTAAAVAAAQEIATCEKEEAELPPIPAKSGPKNNRRKTTEMAHPSNAMLNS